MYIKISFDDYKPWGGAEATYDIIEQEDKLKALEEYLEEMFQHEVPTEEEVNDVLWFDAESVLKSLNIDC